MKISTSVFSKKLLGYRITDCAVRRKDFFYLVAREDNIQWTDWADEGSCPREEALQKRIITFMKEKPSESQWGHGWLNGFSRLTCEVSNIPK